MKLCCCTLYVGNISCSSGLSIVYFESDVIRIIRGCYNEKVCSKLGYFTSEDAVRREDNMAAYMCLKRNQKKITNLSPP